METEDRWFEEQQEYAWALEAQRAACANIDAAVAAKRLESDRLRDRVAVLNIALMRAISTLERSGDEYGVCEELRAAHRGQNV